MRIRLLRRWGPTQAGESVDVDPVQGRWLIDHGFGTASGEPAPKQEAAAPGEHGSDPLASGDGTRQGPPAMVKGERRDNNAAPLPGSPGHEGDASGTREDPAPSGGQPAKTRRPARRKASS